MAAASGQRPDGWSHRPGEQHVIPPGRHQIVMVDMPAAQPAAPQPPRTGPVLGIAPVTPDPAAEDDRW